MKCRHVALKPATLLVATTLAISACGALGWQWWNATRDVRALTSAIAASHLSAETKAVLSGLARSDSAWENGLVAKLVGPLACKEIVWHGKINVGKQGTEDLYIFDAFYRPVADMPLPPVCVVLDRQHNVVAWAEVAPFSAGFLEARLENDSVLTIITASNWFSGKGIYRYRVGGPSIVPLDEGTFVPFGKGTPIRSLPRLRTVVLHAKRHSGHVR